MKASLKSFIGYFPQSKTWKSKSTQCTEFSTLFNLLNILLWHCLKCTFYQQFFKLLHFAAQIRHLKQLLSTLFPKAIRPTLPISSNSVIIMLSSHKILFLTVHLSDHTEHLSPIKWMNSLSTKKLLSNLIKQA